MAGIDNIYAYSYKEYKDFKDWADKQVHTFYDGLKVCIGDSISDIEEDDYTLKGWEYGIPIVSSPFWLDAYLVQNCKFKFVLNRLGYVYKKKAYDNLKNTDLSGKPTGDFQQNRKIVIKDRHGNKCKLHNKPYRIYVKNKGYKQPKWSINTFDGMSYNDDTNKWVSRHSCYPAYQSCNYLTSIKSLVRHLRKQYLPTDITFYLAGRCVGENYTIYIR